MQQNRSSAVMQSRYEPADSLDDYPSPPWSVRALLEQITEFGTSCREPCANRGHMVKVLKERFTEVDAFDIHDYGAGFPVRDYLASPRPGKVDWTVMNPPFRLAERFIVRGLLTSEIGVAVLVRTAFLESIGRYNDLFSKMPPARVLQFTERVVMHKGRLSEKGSTATAYCWLIWDAKRKVRAPEFGWIAPRRKRLEKSSDYR